MRTPQRARVIIDLIDSNSFRRVAEIGVCKGETAIPVMISCQINDFLLVDPDFNNVHGLIEMAQSHHFVRLADMTSESAAVITDDFYFDLVFVDALHDEESVDRDIHLWTPKVRKGGIICGHDYDNRRFPGVKNAVDRMFGVENVRTEPVRACKVWIVQL